MIRTVGELKRAIADAEKLNPLLSDESLVVVFGVESIDEIKGETTRYFDGAEIASLYIETTSNSYDTGGHCCTCGGDE